MNSYDQQVAKLATELLNNQRLTFIARDLGFPDHTAIHDAVKAILADGIARVLWQYQVEKA